MWIVYAIAASVIWGLDYSIAERIFKDKISPFTLIACQMAIGAVVFIFIGYFYQLKSDINVILSNKNLLWLVITSIVVFNLGNLLIFISIAAKNATIAGLIELSYPIFIVLFSWLLFNEFHLNSQVILGSVLIAMGIVLIAFYA